MGPSLFNSQVKTFPRSFTLTFIWILFRLILDMVYRNCLVVLLLPKIVKGKLLQKKIVCYRVRFLIKDHSDFWGLFITLPWFYFEFWWWQNEVIFKFDFGTHDICFLFGRIITLAYIWISTFCKFFLVFYLHTNPFCLCVIFLLPGLILKFLIWIWPSAQEE